MVRVVEGRGVEVAAGEGSVGRGAEVEEDTGERGEGVRVEVVQAARMRARVRRVRVGLVRGMRGCPWVITATGSRPATAKPPCGGFGWRGNQRGWGSVIQVIVAHLDEGPDSCCFMCRRRGFFMPVL
jgi:hypothetical protein